MSAGLVVCVIAVVVALAAAIAIRVEAQQPSPPVEERTYIGTRSAIVPLDQPTIRLEVGGRLFAEPAVDAPVVLRIDVAVDAELVTTNSDGWRRVTVAGIRGWLAPPGAVLPAPEVVWSEVTDRDLGVLAERLERLGERFGPPISWAGYNLFSDLGSGDGEQLVERLRPVAEGVTGAYRSRFGSALSPPPVFEAAVVIFSEPDDYQAFLATDLGVDDTWTAGISPPGIALLTVGERSFEEVAAVLVHELTHVINRELFGDALPPWLEEGMAEDLAYSPLDRAGRLQIGELPQVRRSVAHRFEPGGRTVLERHEYTPAPRLEIACTLRAWPKTDGPDVDRLVHQTHAEFARPEGRRTRYSESALLVRTLLDDSPSLAGADWASIFRRALASGRERRAFDWDGLLAELGVSSRELGQRVARWARRQVDPGECPR